MPVTDMAFSHISAGDAGTWAVAADGRVLYRGGQHLSPQGSKWEVIPGNTVFKMVDSGPYGFVTAITANNGVVYRDQISKQFPSGTGWRNLGKQLESVSVGSFGIWGVDKDQNVHFARRPSLLSGSPLAWRMVPGVKLKQIDAGFGGSVWGVANDSRVYKRTGINHEEPYGKTWLYENAKIKSVTTGLKGVFGVAKNDRVVYKRSKYRTFFISLFLAIYRVCMELKHKKGFSLKYRCRLML